MNRRAYEQKSLCTVRHPSPRATHVGLTIVRTRGVGNLNLPSRGGEFDLEVCSLSNGMQVF